MSPKSILICVVFSFAFSPKTFAYHYSEHLTLSPKRVKKMVFVHRGVRMTYDHVMGIPDCYPSWKGFSQARKSRLKRVIGFFSTLDKSKLYTAAKKGPGSSCSLKYPRQGKLGKAFLRILNRTCYSCPLGYKRTLSSIKSMKACRLPRTRKYAKAVLRGKPGCPKGHFRRFLKGQCYTCPKGFVHALLTLKDPTKNPKACVKKGSIVRAFHHTLMKVDPETGLVLLRNSHHFVPGAWSAWRRLHQQAIAIAAKKGPANLKKALLLNAYADHFLGDAFAAGHLRTPTQHYRWKSKNIINVNRRVLKMHNHENRVGLWVYNERGQVWKAYGDKKLTYSKFHHQLTLEAIRLSVDDIYLANQGKKIPLSKLGRYRALALVPIPETWDRRDPVTGKKRNPKPQLHFPKVLDFYNKLRKSIANLHKNKSQKSGK